MNTPDANKADPIWEATQMDDLNTEQKMSRAILHALDRIRTVPHIAWYCGIGSQMWALLTEALAAEQGKSVREIRLAWNPQRAVNPENPKVIRETAALASPRFFQRMDKELISNSRKGDWKAWQPDRLTCIDELHHHLRKLQRALRLNDHARVSEFSADLANLAMKTAEIHGEEE